MATTLSAPNTATISLDAFGSITISSGASAWMKWKLTDASRTYQLDAIATANASMSN